MPDCLRLMLRGCVCGGPGNAAEQSDACRKLNIFQVENLS